MSGETVYVAAAYGLTAAVVGVLIVRVAVAHATWSRRVRALEQAASS